MAGSKKKTSKKSKPAKTAPKTKAAPKKAAPKKAAPKTKAMPKKAAPKNAATKKAATQKSTTSSSSAKTFADKLRDCDAGTPVWFTVAGGIEHAEIQRRGAEGTVVILTDAGATSVVPSNTIFETADQARAARDR